MPDDAESEIKELRARLAALENGLNGPGLPETPAPIPAKSSTWPIWALVIFVIVAIIAGAKRGDGPTKQGLEEAVAATFRDPSSVQFRNDHVKNGYFCGEVNGKNGFGAYSGFQPFLADASESEKIYPDFGKDYMSADEHKELIEMDRNACEYQKESRKGLKLSSDEKDIPQCVSIAQDDEKFKRAQEYLEHFRACLSGPD